MKNTDIQTALQKIVLGVLEAASSSSHGAPGGILYAAMMGQGASLKQYQSFMDGMVRSKLLTQNGECFFTTAEGERFKGVLQAKFGTETPVKKKSPQKSSGLSI